MKMSPSHWRRAILAGVLAGMAVQAEPSWAAKCATVQIEILQELAFERQAFEARMRINNGLPNIKLDNLRVELEIQDEFGTPVLFTSDPNATNAFFYVRVDSMSGVNNVTGSGTVAPQSEATIRWLIIPSPGAAGEQAQGTLYSVGARLNYKTAGTDNATEVIPDRISVLPMPKLEMDYFLPYWVYGDDAWTDRVEPAEPFGLGLRVRNMGYGTARNLTVESGKPQIVDNEQGLLVAFRVLGCEVNGSEAQPTLLANLGSIQRNQAKVARWIMACPLSGRFTSFSASFTHSDELGGKLTSLLSAVRTHQLVHDVLVDTPGRDLVRDFLTYNSNTLAYAVYESDNVDTTVTNMSSASTLSAISSNGPGATCQLTTPVTSGALYAKVSIPNGRYWGVTGVERLADGKRLRSDNVWISRERFKEKPEVWYYHLNLFDINGGGAYRVALQQVAQPDAEPPGLHFIGPKVVRVGESLGFIVEAADPNGDPIGLTAEPMPVGATFVDHGDGTASFQWIPAAGQYGVHPVRFTASDGALESFEIVRIYVGRADEAMTNGLPASLTGWEPEIKDLWASSRQNKSTVWWDSQDGLLYELYACTNPFAAAPVWQKMGTPQEGEGEWTDREVTLSTNEMRHYYRVVLAGDRPNTNGVWAVMRRDVSAATYTMISPPVQMDRRFDGGLGETLAEALQGSNGGAGAGGDEVYVMEAGGTWRVLYLDAEGTWRESDGSISHYELPAGQGLWVARKSGGPARITFTGAVGNTTTQHVALAAGFNLLGLSEGRDLPMGATMATAGPKGGAYEEEADQMVFQNPDGSWRWLMFVTNWGAPYDGQWFDLRTYQLVPTNAVLEPGAAYYYLRRGGPTTIEY